MIMESNLALCLLLLLFYMPIALCSNQTCIAWEREALLHFKAGLEDPGGLLSSWDDGEDCCSWERVSCSKRNGHVVGLHLYNPRPGFNSSSLGGEINQSLLSLKHLNYLDLSCNEFGGMPIPAFIGSMKKLRYLDLSLAGFGSEVPHQIGNLSRLQYLDLAANKLQGDLVEAHFLGLAKLEFFDVSLNNLSLNVASDWSPPPLLTHVGFGSCNLGPQFPTWLQKLRNVSEIDLSHSRISGVIPADFFQSFSSALKSIFMSENDIKGQLPSSLEHLSVTEFSFSDNQLEGPLPLFSSKLYDLDLSNNLFSGAIPPKFWEKASGLAVVDLSANNLSGNIHHSICKLKKIRTLDLSINNLSGEIPDCWNKSINLAVLNLSNNSLSGSIPKSISSLCQMEALYVSQNSLSGELPFQNCMSLPYMMALDLGHNKFSGNIPGWIGDKLKALRILRLRSNMFTGTIPNELGSLPFLRVIDLAHNNISGGIPRNFGSLTGIRFASEYLANGTFYSRGSVVLDFRGREDGYILAPATIDLAGNYLDGVIPEEVTTLYGLQNLNLSGNHLIGKISENISMLKQLESLDLSNNRLFGPIPAGMTTLSFLNHLNLSYNDLSGPIPSGGQLQMLPDPSIYFGNDDLCGLPLDVKCHDDDNNGATQTNGDGEDQHNEPDMVWFYISMAPGFVVGFWTVCGILMLNKKWRITYFRFVDDVSDRIYVVVAINRNRMSRWWSG